MAANIARAGLAPYLGTVPSRARPLAVLVAALFAISWAAPLIRLTEAPPLAVAAWRLTIATAVLLPLFLLSNARREWVGVPGRDVAIAVLAGVALALHFATWITSVRLTSVAASSVLVALSPLFSWLLSHHFLRERPAGAQATGIVLAMSGAAVIALGDAWTGGRSALHGDLLALLGALFGAVYFVSGRRLRARLSLVAYVTPVYGVSAAVLLAWAAARGEAFRAYLPADWAVFAALAAGPMLVGHTGLNYALRFFPAYAVNVAALAEPVGATLIAWLLPTIAEPPGSPAVVGGAVCLGGITLSLGAAQGRRDAL
jgi:drug/metabolite transporter (DMT)-like permease